MNAVPALPPTPDVIPHVCFLLGLVKNNPDVLNESVFTPGPFVTAGTAGFPFTCALKREKPSEMFKYAQHVTGNQYFFQTTIHQ